VVTLSEKSSKNKSKKKTSKSKTTSSSKTKATTSKKTTTKKTAAKPKKTTTKKITTKTKKTTKPVKKSKKKRKAQPPAEIKPKKPRRLPLEQPVKGVIMNYQRGTVNQRHQYGLIQLDGVTTVAQAAPYIGRSVILHYNEEKSNQGRIISVHGRTGVLRARFRRGLAAEALAKEVLVY
jgi:ribosomal protein L35AE/L33A